MLGPLEPPVTKVLRTLLLKKNILKKYLNFFYLSLTLFKYYFFESIFSKYHRLRYLFIWNVGHFSV